MRTEHHKANMTTMWITIISHDGTEQLTQRWHRPLSAEDFFTSL